MGEGRGEGDREQGGKKDGNGTDVRPSTDRVETSGCPLRRQRWCKGRRAATAGEAGKGVEGKLRSQRQTRPLVCLFFTARPAHHAPPSLAPLPSSVRLADTASAHRTAQPSTSTHPPPRPTLHTLNESLPLLPHGRGGKPRDPTHQQPSRQGSVSGGDAEPTQKRPLPHYPPPACANMQSGGWLAHAPGAWGQLGVGGKGTPACPRNRGSSRLGGRTRRQNLKYRHHQGGTGRSLAAAVGGGLQGRESTEAFWGG